MIAALAITVAIASGSGLSGVTGDQAIVVTAPSWDSTRASVSAYDRRDGSWSRVLATSAWLGSAGLAPAEARRQRTGTTPAGTFRLRWAFGRAADPGTAMRYVRIDRTDVWPYNPADPATYNVFQPHGAARMAGWESWRREMLWDFGRQYRYSVVLDYNLPRGRVTTGTDSIRRTTRPADTAAGGGIFLHVSDGGPTAGCIALASSDMREVLRWLDPSAKPVIVVRVR